MAKRKKLKLKKNARKAILYVIIFTFLSVFLVNKYKEYRYHQTNEYKLISINYTLKEANKIEKELTKKQVKEVIEKQKKDSVLLSLINERTSLGFILLISFKSLLYFFRISLASFIIEWDNFLIVLSSNIS